jgi:hypothetical protein
MAGWNTIETIRMLEKRADVLGMRFTAYRNDHPGSQENVALVPKDQDSLPIYVRDATFFVGTLEAAGQFMQGILWARDYDGMLKISNTKKRERKEQDERNRRLVRLLKQKNTDEDLETT